VVPGATGCHTTEPELQSPKWFGPLQTRAPSSEHKPLLLDELVVPEGDDALAVPDGVVAPVFEDGGRVDCAEDGDAVEMVRGLVLLALAVAESLPSLLLEDGGWVVATDVVATGDVVWADGAVELVGIGEALPAVWRAAAPVGAGPVESLFFVGEVSAAPLLTMSVLRPLTPLVCAAAEASHEGPVADTTLEESPLEMNCPGCGMATSLLSGLLHSDVGRLMM